MAGNLDLTESSEADVIAVKNAELSLNGRKILTDVTLHLTERRIGIIGSNGSGKTTLLRLIAGLLPPDRGSVRVAGLDPARARKALLPHLGILFQNPDHQILFPTVEEELSFGLRQMGLTRAAAAAKSRAALEASGRLHWAGISVATLSQGQRQWLCLQAVLLMEPRTILLDEPFSGLDLPMKIRLTRRLSGLKQRLITISHDPAHLQDAERVIWLERGKIHADGPAPEVLARFCEDAQEKGARDVDADLAD